MRTDERNGLLAAYGSGPEGLEAGLKDVPHEAWDWKPGPGRWSVHEIVVHLADSEAHAYIRCRTLIAEPGKTVMAYDQDRWASELGYAGQSTDDALALFTLLRRMTHRLLADAPHSVWEQSIHHPEHGMMMLDDWLLSYAKHVPLHLAQIQGNYRDWLEVGRPQAVVTG
jgi:hypothetical protein